MLLYSKIKDNNFSNSNIIMGIGDWGLVIGDWGLGPIPNPQSPIPNPQSPLRIKIIIFELEKLLKIIVKKNNV